MTSLGWNHGLCHTERQRSAGLLSTHPSWLCLSQTNFCQCLICWTFPSCACIRRAQVAKQAGTGHRSSQSKNTFPGHHLFSRSLPWHPPVPTPVIKQATSQERKEHQG